MNENSHLHFVVSCKVFFKQSKGPNFQVRIFIQPQNYYQHKKNISPCLTFLKRTKVLEKTI